MWYISRIYQIKIFQNIKIKLNSRTWMTLKSPVEIFQTLEPMQPRWPPQPPQPPWPQWPSQPHFMKNITDCDGWIIPVTKMTNTGPFLGNGPSKIQFFTDISTISVGGCWGQPMSLFWKLVDETQMPTTPEATSHHSSRKFSILLPLRAIQNYSFHYETPCNWSCSECKEINRICPCKVRMSNRIYYALRYSKINNVQRT